MYELVKVSNNTFYMDCPSKAGFYRIGNNEVVLIDSGSDKDAGKKIKRILDENGFKLVAIYNTHSHADHIGGNSYLQSQTGCKIFAPEYECDFTNHPCFEPAFLYGGMPVAELNGKFLKAQESKAVLLTAADLPAGLEIIELPGHCYNMVGFKTSDDVIFLADCLSSEQTLEKYKIGYIYNVEKYLQTLETVKTLKAAAFVPSHAAVTDSICNLAQINIDVTNEIAGEIAKMLITPKTFEEVLCDVFNTYNLNMNITQNVLVGSTVKSYLTYLCGIGKIKYTFENNKMLWQKV